jgi:hypothetical protein
MPLPVVQGITQEFEILLRPLSLKESNQSNFAGEVRFLLCP